MLKEVSDGLYFDYYRENLFYIEAVIEKLLARIEEIDERRELRGERRCCEHVQYRIKSPESMMLKLKKRGFGTDVASAMRNVYDAAGIRIICAYIDDVYSIARYLARCSDIEIVEIKDYIKNPKKNGYRSYHMILKTQVLYNGETRFVTAEVQIRTIVMNSWATCEHQMKYKKAVTDEESVELLKKCAEEMLKIDCSMMRIRDMMGSNEDACKKEKFAL